ncbi:c-type cytochrome biogenesis protein CcsB [Dethiobacter alkaliphilus]|uniref:Cytochrome c-type biogenesis protein CcsB n=1 Tax=Dethiobacter alkaliphilus AHT 1 TaxID=555088 RepID=C0GG60_DETAL|nr:c-type cytochrome biogenesis protein CcsB [Dethiobacter alkaliphilus]EEG77749.1 cytochrome c-type biogenesis protein CcsB [Dethiobacter alkaliphilus AHT 1]MCW3491136.1 c-type cytochrome biogenesis protein CcsB [Dethiobacter alkaliphilus]
MTGLIEVSQQAVQLENTLFTLAAVGYLLATIGYLANLFGKTEWGPFASIILRVTLLIHTAFIITRGINVQRVPFVGHYEFGNLFIWGSALIYVWTEWRLKEKYYSVGAFMTPLIMIYVAYLTVIPNIIPAVTINRTHTALRPVLQSPWLTYHVTTSVLGYAGFTLAFAAAIMWLVKTYLGEGSGLGRSLPKPKVLEEYMYRGAVFGFLFQTIMIITGAIWADTSWGRYWAWDPKEMWSLITWFVFAVYLHARFTRGWTGFRTVTLVVVGWVCMVFTWVGVAWLLSGIHSFG